jgi:hypothetical protein
MIGRVPNNKFSSAKTERLPKLNNTLTIMVAMVTIMVAMVIVTPRVPSNKVQEGGGWGGKGGEVGERGGGQEMYQHFGNSYPYSPPTNATNAIWYVLHS